MSVDIFFIKEWHISEQTESKTLHSLHHETLLIGLKGNLNLKLDEASYELQSPFIYLNPKDEISILTDLKATDHFFEISFNRNITPNFYFEIARFYKNKNHVGFLNKPCFSNIVSLCGMINFESQQSKKNLNIITNLINSLFSIFLSEQKKQLNDSSDAKHNNLYFNNFLQLLESDNNNIKSTTFYAEQLRISTRHLHKITKDILGINVGQLITARKIIEAKKRLLQTDFNISEIGFALGYTEKSHFTKVFKKTTGLTPLNYRKVFSNAI